METQAATWDEVTVRDEAAARTLSIGELARAGGLTVSALRFYDGAGLLVPHRVDPHTGYRWYAPDQVAQARLVASLRRVGMPLAEIALVLRDWPEPAAVRPLLAQHLRRLAGGLADARRELARVLAQLDQAEQPVPAGWPELVLAGADLARALAAVRFAVGTDPDLPVLGGVLFEADADEVRLVATDRYRLAVAAAPVRPAFDRAGGSGPGVVRLLAPVRFVDAARALLTGPDPDPGLGTRPGEVTLTMTAGRIGLRVGQDEVNGRPMDYDFPDYRRLLSVQTGAPGARRVTVDTPALRAALLADPGPVLSRERDGTTCQVVALGIDDRGDLTVLGRDQLATGATAPVGVDREFLLEALDAGGGGQLVLELDGPIRPLAVRLPDDERAFSILMPIRL